MKKLVVLLGLASLSLIVGTGAAQAQTTPNHVLYGNGNNVFTEAAPLKTELIAQQGRDRYPETMTTQKYSYIGVAGNLGLSDADRSVADSGVAVISKIAILDNVSLRPGVIFGNHAAITIPVTYDFNLRSSDPFVASSVTPYIGGGVVIDTGDQGNTDLLATAGVDYRFNKNWVGNAGVNFGFADHTTDVGIMLGVGYVFPHGN